VFAINLGFPLHPQIFRPQGDFQNFPDLHSTNMAYLKAGIKPCYLLSFFPYIFNESRNKPAECVKVWLTSCAQILCAQFFCAQGFLRTNLILMHLSGHCASPILPGRFDVLPWKGIGKVGQIKNERSSKTFRFFSFPEKQLTPAPSRPPRFPGCPWESSPDPVGH
jgi:hypothetical protein